MCQITVLPDYVTSSPMLFMYLHSGSNSLILIFSTKTYRDEMTVFESLNCILCKQPSARVANQPRSPLQLGCGLAMCNECFKKEQMLARNERKHQCGLCTSITPLYVLSQEDTLVLTPMGYVLLKPFKIPECPICQDEYSDEIEAKKSFALSCGHIICTECYLKTRSFNNCFGFGTKCPTCCNLTHTGLNQRKDRFHDFLNELPEMTRQIETIEKALMNAKDARSCNECDEKDTIDKMFYCSACSFEICAVCAYKRPHPHGAISLLGKQANQMLMKLQQASRNVIKTHKDLVPELHKGLLEGIDIFETKLRSKEETLKDALTWINLQENHESFTKMKSKFESSAKRYLPHLHDFDTEIKELIQTLNEFPDVKKSD
ncbi:unnamed protein product, partial [Mesorhabditis belari]|uniref:RING-type domain-containing protein n=1 Tax=Mesorhabditis belari TaxID=2138241 RepID=A0AAF3EKR6_9BILA